jgi:GDP-L-fucose synthase
MAPQPIKEEYLLTDSLEETNEAYAIAKIAGIELCKFYRRQYGCDFISAMPTNLYGPNDNYDLHNSHVLPALIRKFVEAKNENKNEVEIWGTGSPLREFLHVDDLADACLFLMNKYSEESHINVGSSKEVSIIELANIVKEIVDFKGNITHDLSKPDGTPRKLMDNSKINAMGWKACTELKNGIKEIVNNYNL